MNKEKAKEIFEKVADAMEMPVADVIDKFNAGDRAVVRHVSFAIKMDEL